MSTSENYYYYDSESAAWKPSNLEELESFNNSELYVCCKDESDQFMSQMTYGELRKRLSESSEQEVGDVNDARSDSLTHFGGVWLEKSPHDEDATTLHEGGADCVSNECEVGAQKENNQEDGATHTEKISRRRIQKLIPSRVSRHLFVQQWKEWFFSKALLPGAISLVGVIFIAIAFESREPAWGVLIFGVIMLLAGLIAVIVTGKHLRKFYVRRRCHDLGADYTMHFWVYGFFVPVFVVYLCMGVSLSPALELKGSIRNVVAGIGFLVCVLPSIIQTLRLFFQEGSPQSNDWGAPGLNPEVAISKEEALVVLKEMQIEAKKEDIERYLDVVTLQLWFAIQGDDAKEYANKYLRIAAADGNVACVNYLLSLPEIDVNKPNRKGETALSLATKCDRRKCAELLRAAGAKE